MTNPLILMFVAGVAIGLIHHSRLAIENVRVLSCASRQLHAQYCNTRRNGVSDTASANGGFRWYR
jgi:hypothetical protein